MRRNGNVSVSRVMLFSGIVGLIFSLSSLAAAPAASRASWFGRPMLVAPLRSGWTEPRVAVAPDGTAWAITNDATTGDAIVVFSRDGRHWTRTPTELPGQGSATPDVDIVVTSSGRVIASELDSSLVSTSEGSVSGASSKIVTGYTDDRGQTWSSSQGTPVRDTDRPWLAVGPVDQTTHQPRVYMLFHNLFSGSVLHEMFVATSTDGGATFGTPVPIAPPGSQAFSDLQCADSGAPSGIAVDQRTGRIYAAFGTRTSPAGGCGASATGSFEINVVGETRVWVASSPDGSLNNWTDSLAFDGAPDTISSSFEAIATDSANTVYVAFSQTENPYPDFSRASVRYVWAHSDLSRWSAPITVTNGSPIGTYDPTLVLGKTGKLAIAYYQGSFASSAPPRWSLQLAVVRSATKAPMISHAIIDPRPAYAESANDMGGSCGSGPLVGVENGLTCNRANDDLGMALMKHCQLLVVYPMTNNTAPGASPGTWSALQEAGSRIC